MNNKPETSADIEAELRELSMSAKSASAKYGKYRPTVYGKPIALYFAKLADRIKAARQREKTAIEADALAAGGVVEAARATAEKSSAVGDCAKMREALETVKRYLDGYTVNVLEMRSQVDAALAAPPRICDVSDYKPLADFITKSLHGSQLLKAVNALTLAVVDAALEIAYAPVKVSTSNPKEGGNDGK